MYQGGEEFREIVFNVLRGVLFELTQKAGELTFVLKITSGSAKFALTKADEY